MSMGIKLKALDSDDLTCISTCLQDTVIKVSDLAFIASSYQFAFVGNRFCRESKEEIKIGKRSRVACRFENVLKTSSQNIPISQGEHVLNFLSIHSEKSDNGNYLIFLLFSGAASIKLEVECIEAYVEDIGSPWLTKNIPNHDDGTSQVKDESFEA